MYHNFIVKNFKTLIHIGTHSKLPCTWQILWFPNIRKRMEDGLYTVYHSIPWSSTRNTNGRPSPRRARRRRAGPGRSTPCTQTPHCSPSPSCQSHLDDSKMFYVQIYFGKKAKRIELILRELVAKWFCSRFYLENLPLIVLGKGGGLTMAL